MVLNKTILQDTKNLFKMFIWVKKCYEFYITRYEILQTSYTSVPTSHEKPFRQYNLLTFLCSHSWQKKKKTLEIQGMVMILNPNWGFSQIDLLCFNFQAGLFNGILETYFSITILYVKIDYWKRPFCSWFLLFSIFVPKTCFKMIMDF